jgi:putative Mg2+ transporter-C (MgtC) family protein
LSNWIFVQNTAVALLLGVMIGLERQWRQHPAGLRTNALVALGAAAFVSLSRLMDDQNRPTRVASYVVSGLGFLGGGVILRDGLNVKGLNTAATIWCSGAVGSLAGAGFPIPAMVTTAAVLFVHTAFRPVVHWIELRKQSATDVETNYRLRVTCQHCRDAVIRQILLRHFGSQPYMNIIGLSSEEVEGQRTVVAADVFATKRNDRFMEEMVARLSIEPDVVAVSWQKTPIG